MIKSYEENGKTLYHVSIHYRSPLNRNIRSQKKKKGVQSFAKAQAIEKQLLQECVIAVERKSGRGLLWAEVVARWVEFKKKDRFNPLVPHVLQDYHNGLRLWSEKIWDRPVNELTRADIREIVNHMEANGLSRSFQSRIRDLMNRIFIWAIEEKLVNLLVSPAHGIKVTSNIERTPTILNKKEIVKLLEMARFYEHPWYPIWAMAVMTGCRNGELFALTWDDVDYCNMTIRISKSYSKRMNQTKCTKAGYWRTVPINTELKEILLMLQNQSKDQYVLPHHRDWRIGMQAKVLRDFCKQIGITSIRFHDLRACFATQMLQHQVSPATVMKVCGWKDLDTMGRYIRLAGVDESGATDNLKFLTPKEACDKVTSIFKNKEKIEG